MDASLKRNILIGIASTARFLLLLALGYFLFFNAQFGMYHDDKYKFSIKYPKSWQVILHPKAGVVVAFLRPKDTALDTIQENFSVTIQPVPESLSTLEAFSATVKTQMTDVFGKTINIVEDKPIQWGWHEGHIMSIEAPTPDHLKMINAWVLLDNQSYILTFLGDMRKYAGDALVVNDMIHSFQLTN